MSILYYTIHYIMGPKTIHLRSRQSTEAKRWMDIHSLHLSLHPWSSWKVMPSEKKTERRLFLTAHLKDCALKIISSGLLNVLSKEIIYPNQEKWQLPRNRCFEMGKIAILAIWSIHRQRNFKTLIKFKWVPTSAEFPLHNCQAVL